MSAAPAMTAIDRQALMSFGKAWLARTRPRVVERLRAAFAASASALSVDATPTKGGGDCLGTVTYRIRGDGRLLLSVALALHLGERRLCLSKRLRTVPDGADAPDDPNREPFQTAIFRDRQGQPADDPALLDHVDILADIFRALDSIATARARSVRALKT